MMLRFVVPLLFVSAPVWAQNVGHCGWQASAQALVEPWEENTAMFANGAVRLAAIDTVEPAVASAYLLVLSPPFGDLGERQCRLIGYTADTGFAGLDFKNLASDYDPTVGLKFDLAVQVIDPETALAKGAHLVITLNQSTGLMTVGLSAPRE